MMLSGTHSVRQYNPTQARVVRMRIMTMGSLRGGFFGRNKVGIRGDDEMFRK